MLAEAVVPRLLSRVLSGGQNGFRDQLAGGEPQAGQCEKDIVSSGGLVGLCSNESGEFGLKLRCGPSPVIKGEAGGFHGFPGGIDPCLNGLQLIAGRAVVGVGGPNFADCGIS